MMAISTNILNYLKIKFTPIGQGLPSGGATGPEANENANAENLKSLLIDTTEAYTLSAKAAINYSDAQAELNIGLALSNKIRQDHNTRIKETTELITFLEQRESKLTGTFGAGTMELARRTKAFAGIQSAMGATADQMAQYRASMEINADLYGKQFADAAELAKTKGKETADDFIEGQTAAFRYLSQNTELSAESQASLQLYAAGANRTIEQQVAIQRDLATRMGETVDKSKAFEEIAEGIAGLSSDIRTQYNKMPGSLEMAVLKSKQLGLSMEQLHNTGKGLLDIETSVGKELEYQLLSGKRLTKDGKSLTNAYRQAFMEGNMDKQADIMKDVLVTQREVLDGNNFLAKQALADSMGITLKDLMYMREKEKLQDSLNEQLEAAGLEGVKLDEVLSNPELKKDFELKVQGIGEKGAAAIGKILSDATAKDESRKSPAEKIYELLQSKFDVSVAKTFSTGSAKVSRESANKYATTKMKDVEFAGSLDFQKQIGKQELQARSIAASTDAYDDFNAKTPLIGKAISKATTKLKEKTDLLTGGVTEDLKVNEIEGPGKQNVKVKDGIVQTTEGGTISFDKRDKISIVASPFGTMNDKVAEKIATPQVIAPTNNSDPASLIMNRISQMISQPAPAQTIDTNAIVKAIEQAFKNISLDVNVGIDPMAIDKEIKFRSGNLRSNA